MKQKIRSLLLTFSAAAVLFSCGDAGVQVRVGDDFDTNLDVVGAALASSINPSSSTSVNSELREYGEFISDVEITQLTITIENYTGSTTGQIELQLAGTTFDTGAGFVFENNSSETFTNVGSLSNIANAIQQGDINFGISMTSTTTFGDNDFDVKITMSVLATASDENLNF